MTANNCKNCGHALIKNKDKRLKRKWIHKRTAITLYLTCKTCDCTNPEPEKIIDVITETGDKITLERESAK